MQYRPEIDGLRAFAIIPVVLYHANFGIMQGGFLGVDVFFVISGFLITTIILGDLEADRFSIVGFYERRLRRIAPALLFMCAACVPFAALWMLPSEFDGFGKGLFHSLLMVANFDLWGDDYFAPSNELKPLLHMWSLAVEEQFYLVFPPLLLLLHKASRQRVLTVVAALAVVSFLLTWPISRNDPIANFYLPFSRFWELALGALLALYRPDNIRLPDAIKSALAFSGLLAIVLGCLFLTQVRHHPGPITLIPCVGTVMVIAFASSRNLAGRILSWRPFVWIGLISYSLYLWHQPVFAFARIRNVETLSTAMSITLVGLSIVLAILSYFCVERPFRRSIEYRARLIFGFSGAVGATLVAVGIVVAEADGFKQRGPVLTEVRKASVGFGTQCDGVINPACVTKPQPTMAVWGDSFAMHLVDGIAASEESDDGGVMQINMSSCGPLEGIAPILPKRSKEWSITCTKHNDDVLHYFATEPELRYVVVSSQLKGYLIGDALMKADGTEAALDYASVLADFEESLDKIRSTGLKPVVFAPPPRDGRDAGMCIERARFFSTDEAACAKRRDEQQAFDALTDRLIADVSKRFPVVSLNGYLCGENICRVTDDGVSLYRDEGHLSVQGSKHLGLRLDLYDRLRDAAERGCSAEPGVPHGICQVMPRPEA